MCSEAYSPTFRHFHAYTAYMVNGFKIADYLESIISDYACVDFGSD